MRRFLRVLTWVLGVALLLAAGGFALLVLYVLPHTATVGADDPPHTFEYRPEMVITQTAPGGITYRINNSVATFRLDVLRPDLHADRLFRDYRAALQYCRDHGLPTLPSVQMVLGKCKQFDDRFCSALETAVQNGLPNDSRLGKRAALEALIRKLADLQAMVPAAHRPTVRQAVVHVGAALALGGATPACAADLAREIEMAAAEFQNTREAQPAGFWSQNEALRGIFRQDRYLARGFALDADWPVCVLLARTVMSDAALAEAFGRFRATDARLTNPPVFVFTGGEPARCVSCAELAALVPSDATATNIFAASTLAVAQSAARKAFGAHAGFALVAYAASKEYALLYRLLESGEVDGAQEFMPWIIAAIRSGRLRLDPPPDSGWYDYQWHALETLLAPERAPEARKLQMTPAYRARLENAFKTSLAKNRETHIKQLPILTLGMCSGSGTPPPKVPIGPQFCVEPVATVYLRHARGYRFLRNALRATLGEGMLLRIRVGTTAADADAELHRMAQLCYGIYEQLCREIGRPTDYLDGEMTPEDRADARAEAAAWLAGLAGDADLAADTRVAAPISQMPAGPVRHWATGGVRLERVEYKYLDLPQVDGAIEPVFVAACCYLPTDLFLEFDWRGGVLSREKFRAICDRSSDARTLCAALGAAPPPRPGEELPWRPILLALLALVAAATALWQRHRLRAIWERRPRWLFLKTLAVLILFLLAAALVLALSPRWRTRLLVEYVAPINDGTGLAIQTWIEGHASQAMADELMNLLADADAQTRYLASNYIGCRTDF